MSPDAEKAALEAAARIEPLLRRILSWFRVPQEDAEELRQEALLALVRSWERIESPDIWLAGTLSRLCRVYLRKRRRREWVHVAVEGWYLDALASPGLPDQARVELRLDLVPILRHLNERERAILRLRSLGFSCAEAAEHLGCSSSSVPKLTCRAQAEARRVARRLSGGTV